MRLVCVISPVKVVVLRAKNLGLRFELKRGVTILELIESTLAVFGFLAALRAG